MHYAEDYTQPRSFEFSPEQIKIIDASYLLLEAMRANRINEIQISDGVTFKRDCWGADFYNGQGSQPLTYGDLKERKIVPELIKSMREQTDRLRTSKETALPAK